MITIERDGSEATSQEWRELVLTFAELFEGPTVTVAIAGGIKRFVARIEGRDRMRHPGGGVALRRLYDTGPASEVRWYSAAEIQLLRAET